MSAKPDRVAESSDYLYRFADLDRTLEIFKTNSLFFSRPLQWAKTDPYEVLLSRDGADQLFAQCWCQTAVSDAMWRLFGEEGRVVRIRVSKAKLAYAVRTWAQDHDLGYRDGCVKYRPAPRLRRAMRNLATKLRGGFDIATATNTLFMKREAFTHENEWRAVVYGDAPKAGKAGLAIPIDAGELIETVLLDPRSEQAKKDRLIKRFRQAGFEGSVERSVHYDPPKQIVV